MFVRIRRHDGDTCLSEPLRRLPPRRIGAVEDHESVVSGLSAMLADQADLTLVACAPPTVDELLAVTSDLDLVILDLRLSDGSRRPGTCSG